LGDGMSIFQFLLFIIIIIIFILFFKQLFSGAFPKRGIDFEATKDNKQIGGITQLDKTFSTPVPKLSRVEQLAKIADEAIEKEDYIEADKAISSALILEKDNIELLLRYGYILMHMNKLKEAKEVYEKVLSINPKEDIAMVSLANLLHKLGDNELSIKYHKMAIEIDPIYAPHYFNYANTLYDIDKKEEALEYYKKALELDSTIKEEVSKIVDKISFSH
jgi:tetratricopeptide (TPR) repeat protein